MGLHCQRLQSMQLGSDHNWSEMVLVSQIHSSLSATPSSASVAHQPAHMIANVFMCGGDLALYISNNLMKFHPRVCCGSCSCSEPLLLPVFLLQEKGKCLVLQGLLLHCLSQRRLKMFKYNCIVIVSTCIILIIIVV